MGNSSCRYVINAVGKGGETYYTQCQDKQELKAWITDHEERIVMNELKITDKNKHPLLKLFSLKR
ncbi:hypothetical protein [Peribacillus glennii]|uniref:Uncharacterized protein n=1 Tax=Peribacillus glennii TaxID=2303991 RepID=A0A372L756_9BACI|nr:hypothetical protein [Peribacillus glennii]RFU61036.1 hypothetical protein D0466_19630 [Peribacillus glennii]